MLKTAARTTVCTVHSLNAQPGWRHPSEGADPQGGGRDRRI